MGSADLNGDGLTDFVVAEPGGAQVLLSAGDNKLSIGQFLNTAGKALVLADVNGDGRPAISTAMANPIWR